MSLFGLTENNKEGNINRKETYKKVTRNIKEKNNDDIGKNKTLCKSIKTNKISCFKEAKSLKEKERENIYSGKKRKIRRVQSLNMNNANIDLIKINKNKKIENKNNAGTLNSDIDEPIISTKFSRPSKFIIINNNNIIIKEKNSLIDTKTIRAKKDKSNLKYNNEDKKEEDNKRRNKRKSFMRNVKQNVNLFNISSKKFKIFSDS